MPKGYLHPNRHSHALRVSAFHAAAALELSDSLGKLSNDFPEMVNSRELLPLRATARAVETERSESAASANERHEQVNGDDRGNDHEHDLKRLWKAHFVDRPVDDRENREKDQNRDKQVETRHGDSPHRFCIRAVETGKSSAMSVRPYYDGVNPQPHNNGPLRRLCDGREECGDLCMFRPYVTRDGLDFCRHHDPERGRPGPSTPDMADFLFSF